jgi:hypothetical protein
MLARISILCNKRPHYSETSHSLHMKAYTGYRVLDQRGHPVANQVMVHEEGRPSRPLALRHDLRLHSQEFNWGYGGSGPAQLALALAADVLGDDEQAQDVYQSLKFKVVGRLPADGWSLSEDQLRQSIREIQEERDKGRPR